MPIPRRLDQLDRLVINEMGQRMSEHWRRYPKRFDFEENKVVFGLELASSVKTLQRYRPKYEYVIERVTGEVFTIDWEFI